MNGPPGAKHYGPEVPADWQRASSGGPRPFTSWITYRLPDESHYTWESRHHRKGAGPGMVYADRLGLRATRGGEPDSARSPWMRFWAPHRLAWWIAVVFLVGSAFFVAGAAGSLMPSAFGGHHYLSLFAESCYFVGAVLYTLSIYGQVLESLNADARIDPNRQSHPARRFRWFALELTRLEFLTPFVLLLGSLVFNYETVVALGSALDILPKIGVWVTSLVGALLFLVAGILQFIEAGHGYLTFVPRSVSWWVGVCFILGSFGFIVGALPGLGTPGLPTAEHEPGPLIVKVGFLAGGLAYLVGSYLMLPELFTQLRAHTRNARHSTDHRRDTAV